MADRETCISFVLPCYVQEQGWSCAREFCEAKPDTECGCPGCLERVGLTLTFDVEDWNKDHDLSEHWRKRIVSLRTGLLAKHLVCPGYPGHDPAAAERRRPRRATESTGDTPQAESRPTID